MAEFRKDLRLNPADVEGHNNLANALQAKGDLTDAVVEFREALRLKPEYADAHFNLADVLADKGDLDGAIREHRVTLLLRPDDLAAENNLAFAFAQKGDLNRAIFEHRWAARLHSNDARAQYNLGCVLEKRGDLKAALEQYALPQRSPQPTPSIAPTTRGCRKRLNNRTTSVATAGVFRDQGNRDVPRNDGTAPSSEQIGKILLGPGRRRHLRLRSS